MKWRHGDRPSLGRRPVLGAVAILGAGILAFGLPVGAPAQQKTRLTVYTALENEQLKPYKDAFEKDNPDVEIAWVRDSTGVITARLLAEKANPQADVVWGVAATSLMLLSQEGMLEPYKPKGYDRLKPAYHDTKDPPAWVGMDAWAAAICFNTAEAAKRNIPKPESWADLVKPVYKGQIVMPNPASSGTGYLDVSSWLQNMGEANGWKYMDGLHDNIAVYTHSGSKPCKMAAAGEYVVGVSFDLPGAELKTKGAPLDIVLPKEGLGWEMEATAIMKGTKKADAAKKLADWATTKTANVEYNKFYALVADPEVKNFPPNFPPQVEAMLAKNDFVWAASNRERILKEWTKRYDAKSEPKT